MTRALDNALLVNAPVSGFRNKLINGDFDFWQRRTTFSSLGYVADRWLYSAGGAGSNTGSETRVAHTVGTTEVPDQPSYFLRHVVTTSTSNDSFSVCTQPIEYAATLAGKQATITFYAKADAVRSISVELSQVFGSGGSPSSLVNQIGVTKFTLSTSWQRYSVVINIPNINGKVYGTNNDDYLSFTFFFSAGSDFNARTGNRGLQTGTFDISHVSLVEGDALNEINPFTPRSQGQEYALCQRYYWKSYYKGTQPGTVAVSPFFISSHGSCNYLGSSWSLPVVMRKNPTVVAYSPSTGTTGVATVDGVDKTVIVDASTNVIRAYLSNQAVIANQFFSVHLTADAEL